MSEVKKQLDAGDVDGWDLGRSEPFFYPGELEAQIEEGRKAHELSRYTIEELQDEVWRRTFEPMHTALDKLKHIIDKHNGYSPDRPF